MARRNTEEQGKIFVGGLSWETTQDGLLNYFSRFGEVVDSVVMCNETGRSRGFGFVTFRDPSCVATVLAGGPHQLDGRTVDPKSCNPRGASRPQGGGGGGGPPRGGGGGGRKGSGTKIFLGGLPASVNESDLHAFFSEYGKVVEAIIMYDQEQKRSRGFGFVTFETEDPVHQLTGQRYVEMSGKQVECKRAEPKESRMPKAGGGGRGGWGGQQGGGGNWGGPQWGGAPNGGGPPSSGYQGYSGGGGGGGYNNWGGAQSGGYNSGGGGGGYGSYGSGDQTYSGYGSYGQQTSSYGPMRTAGGYGDTSYTATGYNGAAGNGVAPAAAAPVDGGQGYHPYRR
ncbi:unnamed protein product [Ixodes persulcatus]